MKLPTSRRHPILAEGHNELEPEGPVTTAPLAVAAVTALFVGMAVRDRRLSDGMDGQTRSNGSCR